MCRSSHLVNPGLAKDPRSSVRKVAMAGQSGDTGEPLSGRWPSVSIDDRFWRVVEASPTALVLAGTAGVIEMVNRQAELMFGYERAELMNKPLEMLMPERFRGGHINLRRHFLTDMSARVMGAGRDLYGLRK